MPSHPGKEFEIQKRLDRLRDIQKFNKNNNNDNNNNNDGDGRGGGDLITSSATPSKNTTNNNLFIPEASNLNNIFNPLPEEYDVQQRLNLQVPEVDGLLQQRLNNLMGIPDPTP